VPAFLVRAAFRSNHTTLGALCVNVIHVEVDAFTSPPDYTKIANDIDAWLGLAYRNTVPDKYTVQDLTVTGVELQQQVLGQAVKVYGTAGLHPAADQILSRGLCLVGSLKTATPKRYARGRIFMPPALQESMAAEGGAWNPGGTYALQCGAFFTAALQPHANGNDTYSLAVFSRIRLLAGDSKPYYTVLGITTDHLQHYLRSRVSSP
jgi:hypothetical protein